MELIARGTSVPTLFYESTLSAEAALVVKQAARKNQNWKEVSVQSRWWALEIWAADYLRVAPEAGPTKAGS